MTSFTKRVYEMLIRVLVFRSEHPQFFQEGTAEGRLIAEIEQAARTLEAQKGSQTEGRRDARKSTADRAAARRTLLSQLEAISRTAKGMQIADFWLSRDRSDRSLIEMAKIFALRAEGWKARFIEGHLPADFIERLTAAARNVEESIQQQVARKGARVRATSAIAEAQASALAALVSLDPLVENMLRDDLPTLRVWKNARHVPRTSTAVISDDRPTLPLTPPSPDTEQESGSTASA